MPTLFYVDEVLAAWLLSNSLAFSFVVPPLLSLTASGNYSKVFHWKQKGAGRLGTEDEQ